MLHARLERDLAAAKIDELHLAAARHRLRRSVRPGAVFRSEPRAGARIGGAATPEIDTAAGGACAAA